MRANTPDLRLGHRGVLLPQLQHAADVLSRRRRRFARSAVRVPAALRPHLAGGRHREQGPRRHRAARRSRLRERPGLQRRPTLPRRKAWSSATHSTTSSASSVSLPGDTRAQRARVSSAASSAAATERPRDQERGFGASIFMSTKLTDARAAAAVDPELQGRGRHDPAAPQLVSAAKNTMVGLRRRHLHRARATATSVATTTAIASTPSFATTSESATRAVRRPFVKGGCWSGDSKQDGRQQRTPSEGAQTLAQRAHFHVRAAPTAPGRARRKVSPVTATNPRMRK